MTKVAEDDEDGARQRERAEGDGMSITVINVVNAANTGLFPEFPPNLCHFLTVTLRVVNLSTFEEQ